MEKKYTRKQMIVMLIGVTIVSTCLTGVIGLTIMNINLFGETLNSAELKQANQIISENYFGDMNQEQLQAGAISGAVQALGDKHSSYLTPEETADFRGRLESSFEGIGAMIQGFDDKVIISDVLPNSPAQQANLQPNDQIQAVDGRVVDNQTLDEVISQIKGPADTTVTLTIWRNGEVLDVELTRASIAQESAKANIDIDKTLGYGYIDMRQSFGAETAAEFATALTTLGDVKTLVIDLRDNPGGYLQAVSDILSTLVSSAEPYVIIESKDGSQLPYMSDLNENAPYEYVILVNENTASAAEIMTAALQQLANATVVGEQTYGKGTVQQQFDLLNGGVLKLTVEHWLTPDGSSINDVGITPDVEISSSMYYQLPSVILSETIGVGEANAQVLTVQYMLQQSGYDVPVIDGVFSDKLVAVLEQFQAAQGLAKTGVID
ncbi:MAG: S41 family peptidase, partial [Culicoidibacterales bacterium]